jgi:hypothetical protein
MGTWKYTQPPTWRKDAVATSRGWCHPKTGEVLVCCRGLLKLRRKKLDEEDSNLITEDDSLFVLENQNSDRTENFFDLEDESESES